MKNQTNHPGRGSNFNNDLNRKKDQQAKNPGMGRGQNLTDAERRKGGTHSEK